MDIWKFMDLFGKLMTEYDTGIFSVNGGEVYACTLREEQ